MAAKMRAEAEKTAKKAEDSKNTTEGKNVVKRADMETTEGMWAYIGPATKTGLTENAVFSGSRESVEQYLKDTLEKIPQVKMLIVPTRQLAEKKSKARKKGTLLNKYYNDVLSLRDRNKEG